MNRRILLLALAPCVIGTEFGLPAFAQWDLGGTPGNIQAMQSGGQGSLGNGTPSQPYMDPNAIQPNRSQQDYYNQRGFIQNTSPNSGIPFNQTTPYANPALGGGGYLPTTSMPALSPMQEQGLLNPLGHHLPSNLKGVSRSGLPPTTLDSFVKNAGGAASRIYGDEGTNSWPPMNGFPESSSINAGIVGTTNKTLTTGHGSRLPAPSQVNYHSASQLMTQSGPREIRTRQRRHQLQQQQEQQQQQQQQPVNNN